MKSTCDTALATLLFAEDPVLPRVDSSTGATPIEIADDHTRSVPEVSRFVAIAHEVAELVEQKNRAYGSSFATAGPMLRLLYPDGVPPEKYADALLLVRLWDKMMRIATDRDALGEDPWRDILGYAILAISMREARGK